MKDAPNRFLNSKDNWSAGLDKLIQTSKHADEEDSFVLSAEVLCQPQNAERICKISDYYDVQIVHYIRNQADWIYAAWKQ